MVSRSPYGILSILRNTTIKVETSTITTIKEEEKNQREVSNFTFNLVLAATIMIGLILLYLTTKGLLSIIRTIKQILPKKKGNTYEPERPPRTIIKPTVALATSPEERESIERVFQAGCDAARRVAKIEAEKNYNKKITEFEEIQLTPTGLENSNFALAQVHNEKT